MSGNIRVVCRFRPQNSKEIKAKGTVVVDFLDEQTVHLKGQETDHKFTFDRIFLPTNSQQEVYEATALPVIKDIFQGYNGTIFVYGQTSSGKTHTMMGPDGGKGMEDPAMKGIIPRMVSTIFEQVENADENVEFLVCVSYIEIYMEKIRDLLNPSQDNLPVRENKTRGIYVEGTTEVSVATEDDVMEVMRTGQSNRSVGFTNMNAESSRSHSLFVVNVQQKDLNTGSKRSAKLYLVDLAGSEKVGKTGAKGTTLDEAKMINKSLSALGNVINALTDGKSKHIPYRDSKLTRVLQESIGGNSRTTLIVNCSPDSSNEFETLSTLRFGTRAKSIKNKAKVNEERSVAEWKALCNKMQQEIARLKKYIATLEGELGIVKQGGTSDLVNSLQAQAQIPTSTSEASVVAPSASKASVPSGALQELHDQIAELEQQASKKEEKLNIAEEAKNILMDQLSEKQSELESVNVQLQEAMAKEEEQKKVKEEYEEAQHSLIAQVAQKDLEIEALTERSNSVLGEKESLSLTNQRLEEEKRILVAKINELQGGRQRRQRSTSLQAARRPRSASMRTSGPQDSLTPLSQSTDTFNDLLSNAISLSSETTTAPSAEQEALSTRLQEIQEALADEWNRRNEMLVGMEEELTLVQEEFEKLRGCDMLSLKQESLIATRQVEKMKEEHLRRAQEHERDSMALKIAEEKLAARDKQIATLEEQLKMEREMRIAQDHQASQQMEAFARQMEQLKKQSSAAPIQQGGVRTLRGGGGKRRAVQSKESKSSTSWLGSFFKPSPSKPAEPPAQRTPHEMSATDGSVFDF